MPLAITRDRTILNGYARFALARQKGKLTLSCLEYDLSESEALQWLLQAHLQSEELNGFCRILLALDLEPLLQEKARSNQQAGGQQKGLSNLTEAEKVRVRSAVARAASVSVGNVAKVKQVLADAEPDIVESLRRGEISIHRAWTWRKAQSEDQLDALGRFRFEKGLMSEVRQLALGHRRRAISFGPALEQCSDRTSHCNHLSSGVLELKVASARSKSN